MAKDWGIKITKPGASTTSNDPRDILLSSAYQMFKYHGVYSTSVTFNPGDRSVTASVTHGLGYVPAFIAYGVRSDDNSNFIIPSLPYGISEFDFAEAWADTQKIYFKVSLFGGYSSNKEYGWNERIVDITNTYDAKWDLVDGLVTIGNYSGDGRECALRGTYLQLAKSQTISSAVLNFHVDSKGGGSGDMKIRTVGMDEDNTALWSSGDYPMSRPQTSAYRTQSQSMGSTPFDFGINVKSIVEEIIGRSGWSSGNSIGFYIFNDSSPNDVYAMSYWSGWYSSSCYLDILLPGTLTVNLRAIVFKDKIA